MIIQGVVDRFDPADVLDTIEQHAATSLLIVGDPMARPLVDVLRDESSAGRTATCPRCATCSPAARCSRPT